MIGIGEDGRNLERYRGWRGEWREKGRDDI